MLIWTWWKWNRRVCLWAVIATLLMTKENCHSRVLFLLPWPLPKFSSSHWKAYLSEFSHGNIHPSHFDPLMPLTSWGLLLSLNRWRMLSPIEDEVRGGSSVALMLRSASLSLSCYDCTFSPRICVRRNPFHRERLGVENITYNRVWMANLKELHISARYSLLLRLAPSPPFISNKIYLFLTKSLYGQEYRKVRPGASQSSRLVSGPSGRVLIKKHRM